MLLTNRRDVVGIMLFGYPVLKKTSQWKKSDAAESSLIIVMGGAMMVAGSDSGHTVTTSAVDVLAHCCFEWTAMRRGRADDDVQQVACAVESCLASFGLDQVGVAWESL
ncbi:hypothetical protein FUT69_08135 [Xylella taiwanensis]|uniref:Uncharacterized protein n=1 Tax=Xylella taiwanensis TaxID=1444770 RepID=Z9JGA6_9GAMM|nr:hypothetical protein [Xylella taiwanensis]AXI83668.1 hypothetical protein AB672_06855 [Xylella taiwanensis]EWS77224.1 hypothetical protein AF72_11935 [Xylella taiwanensis]MCD8456758.1 hypothetical protein [Xylella taiwanensis]MCD8459168.1 hypothetical protein [Xylella taiwanensis]MCD8461940.1 hypothetical protein [Xylella taiwanensis]